MNSKQLKSFKTQQLKKSNQRLLNATYPKELVIVAEGDSWFDYPLKKDVIDYLRYKGFAIKKFAKAGDTLENMIYGSKYKIRNSKIIHEGPISLQTTLNAIKKYNPNFVLFSGGGNDIIGSEIVSYLNHRNSKPASLINKEIFEISLNRIKKALEFYIESILLTGPEVHILMDGYDYAKVNGKGYSFIFKNIKGPWILPAMGAKAISNEDDQKDIIKYLVDKFNTLLQELDVKYDQFHHIDLRGQFPDENQWDNEIHLKNNGNKKVANIYHDRMNSILSLDPIVEYEEQLLV